jgi:hypothetical protein
MAPAAAPAKKAAAAPAAADEPAPVEGPAAAVSDEVFAALDYLLGKDTSELGARVRNALVSAYFDADGIPDHYPAPVSDTVPMSKADLMARARAQLAAAQYEVDALNAQMQLSDFAPGMGVMTPKDALASLVEMLGGPEAAAAAMASLADPDAKG